ncbi:response regulator [Longibacter salinarum]|uniref:response regulator n=1 Tax=Longibacter salinarum TaxID=1850348 RepID=UPI0015CF07EB|nr:response regulator [Longibacter salinarum]
MTTASDVPRSSTTTPHIVVIEDDDNLLQTYGVFLRHFLSAEPVKLFDAIEPALEYLRDATPDIILTDLSLPSVEDAGVVSILHDAAPDVPILVISGSSSNRLVRESLDGGAIGYVLKGKRSEIVEGVEAALRGESYLSGELSI